MAIDAGAIAAIQAALPSTADGAALTPIGPIGGSAPTSPFGHMVSNELESVNQQLLVSQTDLQQLATGTAQNLHQVMIRLEESRLSFQLLLQVRNRVLEAYQDVMKMQV